MEKQESSIKPKLQSVFSMGELDFNRYDQHLKYVEEWCGKVNAIDIPELIMVQNYFSGVNTLYIIWRELIVVNNSKEDVDNLDKNILNIKKSKRKWEGGVRNNTPISPVLKLKLVDQIDSFTRELYKQKQWIGLGIVLKRNLSTKEKIKAGVKGHIGGMDDLPEP